MGAVVAMAAAMAVADTVDRQHRCLRGYRQYARLSQRWRVAQRASKLSSRRAGLTFGEALMRIHRIALPAVFAAGFALAPFSIAKAQYYYPPCAFPLAWPVCAAGAIVGTAANIATAPVWLLSGAPPPFYPGRYYAPGYYATPPGYYAPPPPAAYYYPPR